jgi:putative transposase
MAQTMRDEVIEELLQGYSEPQDLLGEEGLFKQLKKKLLARALGAELTDHLGYEKGDPSDRGSGNSRNGYSTDRDRRRRDHRNRGAARPHRQLRAADRGEGSDPARWFDDRIISLYARGRSVKVSPDLISWVADAVLEEVREWQNRPLDPVYPVIFFDALRVRIRDERLVRNKAVYVALALNVEGEKEVLGLWIEQSEGVKFWLKVMNELKTRGIVDILIAVVDGLKGFPEAIGTVFPPTMVQTCIVHLIRNSLAFASWKDRKIIMPDLKAVYRAETAESARAEPDAFEAQWGRRYPSIGQGLAPSLGARRAAVRVPAGNPQNDLHDG